MKRKTFAIEIAEKKESGGRIVINTGALDRDRDRVRPQGARLENYLKNPVVLWGHNYHEPYATVGKTTALTITPDGIEAEFELRPPANEQDPQNIVRLLWDGGWIRTASVGFIPDMSTATMNEEGGWDFEDWDLLEWSLVPVPANQEALRLAVKAFSAKAESQPAADAAQQSVSSPAPQAKSDEARAVELIASYGETLLKIFKIYTR